MKILAPLLSGWFLFSSCLFAVSPYIPIDCDFEVYGKQFTVEVRVLNTPIVRAYTWQGTNVFNPSGYNAYFSFAKDVNATNMIVVTGVCYSSYIDFQIKSNSFARPVSGWYASVMLTKTSDGSVHSIGCGDLTIKASPEVNASGTFFSQRAINGSEYGPFTGSFTNWPFVLSGEFLGGYVDIPTFNSSNSTIQSQITANLTNQNASNTTIQVQVTANTTGKTDLATYTANIVAQANTNTWFQALYNGQVNTNSGFEVRISAEEAKSAAQVSTNAGFQVIHAAQVNTNAGFESRISSEETKSTAQINTNAGFQVFNTAQAATNTYFQDKFVSQEITNAEFQNSITANQTNQANTNASFEIRISSNETFCMTTQPATNAALLLRITNNEAAQANTNTAFQVLFTNQANTNTVFSLRIGSNETFRVTTQPATNVALQNQITLNMTNQSATNSIFRAELNALNAGTNISSRYFARTNASETVEVLATGLGVTATRTNSIFYFNPPVGVHLISVDIRVRGDYTSSGQIFLSMGTNDFDSSTVATTKIPSASCVRETDGGNVTVVPRPYFNPTYDGTTVVSGMGTSAAEIYKLHLGY